MQAEAYMLMTYECEQCKQREEIWNSRDGITPFCVSCTKCNGIMQHVEWEKDVFAPRHSPADEDRVFVDLTLERAKQKAKEKVERWWDHPQSPMSTRFDSKDDAMYCFANSMLEEFAPHSPDLVSGAEYYDKHWKIPKQSRADSRGFHDYERSDHELA